MKVSTFIFQIIFFVALDQITKVIFASRDFFVGFMHFHLVKNFGLSFGLNFGANINLAVIILATILFLVYARGQKLNIGISLVIAGALSNIIDRAVLGYVRDFWDIGLNFTFNLADLYIALGLFVLVFYPDKSSGNQEQAVE